MPLVHGTTTIGCADALLVVGKQYGCLLGRGCCVAMDMLTAWLVQMGLGKCMGCVWMLLWLCTVFAVHVCGTRATTRSNDVKWPNPAVARRVWLWLGVSVHAY